MTLSIEELRAQKDRLDREREEVERRLQEAERFERAEAAKVLITELRDFTRRIDELKDERQKLLGRIREVAPRVGDFTYASEDHRLTLSSARAGMKQPDLLDKVMAALHETDIHVEPRTPRFRLFHGLRPVGTMQVHPKRLVITVSDPIIDYTIITEAQELNTRYPGLAELEYADHRRVREGVPGRPAGGRYALSLQVRAADTGSLDVVLPLAVRALDHVASYWDHVLPGDESKIFEPMPLPDARGDATMDQAAAG